MELLHPINVILGPVREIDFEEELFQKGEEEVWN